MSAQAAKYDSSIQGTVKKGGGVCAGLVVTPQPVIVTSTACDEDLIRVGKVLTLWLGRRGNETQHDIRRLCHPPRVLPGHLRALRRASFAFTTRLCYSSIITPSL